MKYFWPALYCELLKARKSIVLILTTFGLSILPLVGGLFMVILKNPEQAQSMGLISTKAQLTAGVADWPTFYGIITQGMAIGGAIVFGFITAWVFGREFSDRTIKNLLSLPCSRANTVSAKLLVVAIWVIGLTLWIFLLSFVIGRWVDIPGWSKELERNAFWRIIITSLLTYLLQPFVALFASIGRGYLSSLGWIFLSLAAGQIAAVLGWGGWFPWSIPAMYTGMAGPSAELIGPQSYLIITFAFISSIVAIYLWWYKADHTR